MLEGLRGQECGRKPNSGLKICDLDRGKLIHRYETGVMIWQTDGLAV